MRKPMLGVALVLALAPATLVRAGVTNPDISVIGQPFLRWTDDGNSFSRDRFTFDAGETEIVLDAALNPYARGFFALSFASGETAVEEGYFTLNRGLPGGIELKGGKYRVGFGKLNPSHPHTWPFAERPGVLSYLPGDESFDDTGLDASWRVPLPGTIAVTLAGDVLQGDSFRAPRTPTQSPNDPLALAPENGDGALEPRAAWLGRLSAFVPAGDRSGVELGFSATEGTRNVAAKARHDVIGGDVKAKLWTNANAYLLVQGEFLALHRQDAGWDGVRAVYTRNDRHTQGGYLFADFNWAQRYDAGASFESFEDPDAQGSQSAVGLFAGLALMEETTVFRLDWRRVQPARPFTATTDPDPIQQLTLRAIFSMGPHKAHQF